MDDLISRAAAIDAITQIKRTDNWKAAVCMVIYELPSAQPESTMGQLNGDGVVNKQEEIIHCKDCKHYEKGWVHCNRVTWWNGKDDFCSRAERKEN